MGQQQKQLSQQQVRASIESRIERFGTTIENFFKDAAAKYHPDLKKRELKRKVTRFKEGGAAPDFVTQHIRVLANV